MNPAPVIFYEFHGKVFGDIELDCAVRDCVVFYLSLLLRIEDKIAFCLLILVWRRVFSVKIQPGRQMDAVLGRFMNS